MARSLSANFDMLISLARRLSFNIGNRPAAPAARSLTTDVPDLASLLEAEISRARRHEWSLGAIAFGSLASHEVKAIQGAVRETDRIAAGPHGLVVLLPETDAVGLRISAERLTSLVAISPGAVVAVSFPDDALTVGHLCELLKAPVNASHTTRREIHFKRVVAA